MDLKTRLILAGTKLAKLPMEFLGYKFKDKSLLEQALTTPAYRMDKPEAHDNQRLEFLGDAVLQLLTSDLLFKENSSDCEGILTAKRAQVVSSVSLCRAAAECGIAPMLRRNAAAGEISPKSKMLADAVEAILGAAWIDGGMEAARKVFESLGLETAIYLARKPCANHKGDLQIKAQSFKPPRRPVYELISVVGPSHKPIFTIEANLKGVGSATASAGTRKEAENLAAGLLLEQMNG